MIFRTEKLEHLKNIQNSKHNENLNRISRNILKNIWPDSQNNTFCETIQSIAIKWTNQFMILIQNWLSQTSQKYSIKISTLQESSHGTQQNQQIQEYLFNLTKYVQSMEHPLLVSINNIEKLYLKYPSDQMIQQPRRSLYNTEQNSIATQIKKKKSLSIDSFKSNSLTKTRSKSKIRNLSFFSNSLNTSTSKQNTNLFETFSKQFKKNSNLNTTVKKVKKQHNFTRTANLSNNTYSGDFQQKINSFSENSCNQKNLNSQELKSKLQERLTSTCSSVFFNQVVLQKPIQKVQVDKQNIQNSPNTLYKRDSINSNQIKLDQNQSIINKSIVEDFKHQILTQIQNKEKQNYDNLIKNFEDKLNNKLQGFMNKILQSKQLNNKEQNINQISNKEQSYGQIKPAICIKQESKQKYLTKSINLPQDKYLAPSHQQKQEITQKINNIQIKKMSVPQTSVIQKSKESSIKNLYQQNLQTVKAQQIPQIKIIEQKSHVNRQNRINSSSIVQKDPSKIIKSKTKNNTTIISQSKSVLKAQDKQNVQKSIINKQASTKTAPKFNNKIQSESSIDSIDIIDGKGIKQNPPIKSNQHSDKNLNQNVIKTSQSKKQTQINTKQDNFYTKRVKQMKFNMEMSIKSFKEVCQKLTLPVNQTFLILFLTSYKEFSQTNSLPFLTKQIKQIWTGLGIEEQIKKKLPLNEQKFILGSLGKIQKMLNLNCPSQKKVKIKDYSQKCIKCIENTFFQKPTLTMKFQSQIIGKIQAIKSILKSLEPQ